jgi:hypothetical protein
VLELIETMVRPAGLEPATSWFVGAFCFAKCKEEKPKKKERDGATGPGGTEGR